MICRRGFLSAAGVGLGGVAVASRTARSQSTTTVSGSIESAVGASIEGSTVEFFSPETTNFTKATIEDGRFEAEIEAGVTQYVTFFHQDSTGDYRTADDDVPVLYGLDDRLTVEEGTDEIDPYEVPQGYLTQIRFEDPNGNPIERLPVTFRATTGSGTGPGRFTTNADGYVYTEDESDPGVELSGEVSIELQEPGGGGGGQPIDRITVNEDSEVTVPVRDPEAYGGIVRGSGTEASGATEADAGESTARGDGDGGSPASDGASADGDHRGFFTNDPDSSFAVLDDPVTLTWAGIGVSIVGIIVQLFGRQS